MYGPLAVSFTLKSRELEKTDKQSFKIKTKRNRRTKIKPNNGKRKTNVEKPLKKTKKVDFIYNDFIACRQPSVTVDRKLEKKIEDTGISKESMHVVFVKSSKGKSARG